MFIGREKELTILEDAYNTGAFQLLVVYGRRRVGKTSLLQHFASSKQHVHFFTALEANESENLRAFSEAILAPRTQNAGSIKKFSTEPPRETSIGTPASSPFAIESPTPQFSSFQDALTYLFNQAETERTVLVIDEYPYLAQSNSEISSLLQNLIDSRKATSKLFLVLCGSSMSFMEHQVLGEKSPLYGRRTGQIKVEPFDIFDAKRLLGSTNFIQAVEFYSLVGGVPLYLEQLDSNKTVEWNIANRVFRQGSFLSVEPENYLMQEMRSPATYNSIITAIANGNEKPSDIASATHMSTAALSPYLNNLSELGVITRTTPEIRANRKQVLYRITDNLFRFWYRFVPRYTTALNAGMHEQVAHFVVERDLSTFAGPAFEEICRQWIKRQFATGQISFIPAGIGSWWGNDPTRKEQAEVDVVVTGINKELILGECKWQNSPVGTDVLQLLEHRSSFLADRETKTLYLYLFSKSGFTDECQSRAEQLGNVRLITLEEMFEDNKIDKPEKEDGLNL